MNMMKITRRTVDPITFVERVGVEFIPRIEDSVLDDQLGGSMSYEAPRNLPRASLPPPPPPPEECRPPTPPKRRGNENPITPRNPSLSPAVQKKRLSNPGGISSPGGTFLSPRSSKRKSLQLSLAQIGEDTEMSEGSMSDMSALQSSISKLEAREAAKVKFVRFTDEVEMIEISRMRNSVIAEIFWASDELADFRYQAFMEEAGLDVAEFD